ncbi:hypothetical protein JCM10296v2_002505 [Rhodotorula toruloides]
MARRRLEPAVGRARRPLTETKEEGEAGDKGGTGRGRSLGRGRIASGCSATEFVEWLFRDVEVQLNPDDPTLSSLWSTRKTKTVSWQVRRRQQRLAIGEGLSQNNVLRQGWAIMVYDGPLPADELDIIKRRRAVRQAGGDPRSILE